MLKSLLLLPLLGTALAGCDPETNRFEITVQCDGAASIQVTHETAGTADDLGEDDLGRAARFMAAWGGVAAWTDVSATAIERGRTRVEATAWLQSLGDLRTRGRQRFEVRLDGDALEVRYPDPTRTAMTAIFLEDAGKVQAVLAAPEAEFEATIDEVRVSLETLLAPWTFDLSIRLPGAVSESVGFVRQADDRVVLRQDVLTLLALMERHVATLREVRGQVAAGALTPEQGHAALVRRDAEVTAAETPRVRCRLPSEPPPVFDARDP